MGPDHRTPLTLRDAAIHGGLFVTACVTTYWFGGAAFADTYQFGGIAFAATLMGILLCHEMGHYVVARRHGVDVSLPYFIPMPPQFTFGTMGAVIKMKSAITDRNALIDVGAAGPLAGLAVAVPLLTIGLWQSELGVLEEGAVLEGNSIFYLSIKYLVFGQLLPSGSLDVHLHPMAFAAWVGILVTFINLIPIGQLDGGHVMRAWIGDRHEKLSARLHGALLAVAVTVAAGMIVVARSRGAPWYDAAFWALSGALPWVTWTVLLALLRRGGDGQYHPPVGGGELSPGRRRLAALVLIVFLLIFTPVPMVPAL